MGITILILLVFRILVWIPILLIDVENLTGFIRQNEFLAILNNFSGQALGNLSIMAMGISPYITASIVIQLRSEEHTSELQSRPHLVCRLLLEKKKKKQKQ